MDQDDFFGFDATPLDDDLGGGCDREDDDDFDALNDETFGMCASTGDWEDQHRQLSGLEEDGVTDGFFKDNDEGDKLDGVRIPGSTLSSHVPYSQVALNNGLGNLVMGTPPSYSTPPKPSLIDPVKLSESPGNGIWAPEASMLEKIGFNRGLDDTSMNSQLYQLLNQNNSQHPQQLSNIMALQQRRQQMLSAVPEASVGLGHDTQRSNLFSSSSQMQHQLMSMFDNRTSLQSNFDQQQQQQIHAPSLPLGFASNVKSVADLEMEMRLQQLKVGGNHVEGIVRAEDLERTPVPRLGNDLAKPLMSLFQNQQQQPTQQQQHTAQQQKYKEQQQLHQQKQMMELQQRRNHQYQQQMLHKQQHLQRHTSIHPLTGLPLNAPGSGPHPGNVMQVNRMLPPNMQFLQRRQKEMMMASLNGRQPQQQMMGGILPMGSHLPPSMQLDPNFQNFSPNLRNRNWNEFEHGMGNGGTCIDRRGSFPINGRGREGQFDGRQHGYDRDNHRDFGSNHRDFGNNGGRIRRDSEAEWEEWERTRMEDEYAGLMTPKQKSWLRNIQTMQLTTDNPYRDDYYFVMYEAKRSRVHPDAPLQIQGLKALLPVIGGDQDKETGNTYQPPAMENSLGKLQVASVNAPRKIMDLQVVHLDAKEPTTKLQMEMRTHRMLLLSIEKLYGQLMELEDLDRKISYLPDSPTRDIFIRRAKELTNEMWKSISTNDEYMRSLLSIRKGKTLVLTLGRRLGKDAAMRTMDVVLKYLPYLTQNSQPQHQNTLYILWPLADELLQTASAENLLHFVKGLLPYLRTSKASENSKKDATANKSTKSIKNDELSPLLKSKFSISFIVGVLVQGESAHQKMKLSEHEDWKEFLSSISAVMVQEPNTITDTLVRDSDVANVDRAMSIARILSTGTASVSTTSPPVVVLSRGQTLSSLAKQRGLGGAGASDVNQSSPASSLAGSYLTDRGS